MVDGGGAEVAEAVRFDDSPLAAKLTTWGIAAHMGLLFGTVNAVVLALAAALVAVIVWGYTMWWKRRPTRGARWAGAPAPRGALRRAPVPVVAGLAAAVGWFLPVLGVSLLAFLVDAPLALRGRRTGGDRRPEPVGAAD